jgi:hypothetical protein
MFTNLNNVVDWFCTSLMKLNSSLAACVVITILFCDVTLFSISVFHWTGQWLVATYIRVPSFTFLLHIYFLCITDKCLNTKMSISLLIKVLNVDFSWIICYNFMKIRSIKSIMFHLKILFQEKVGNFCVDIFILILKWIKTATH